MFSISNNEANGCVPKNWISFLLNAKAYISIVLIMVNSCANPVANISFASLPILSDNTASDTPNSLSPLKIIFFKSKIHLWW